MKIHIVQKGDTLWELSKQFGVNFEELKQVNSHISSPDMIMPGMKIKIPSSTKAVKKEAQVKPKEVKKETKKPYKDVSPKPMPVIKEDDKEKPKPVKPEMPIQQPQMPQMPIQPIMQMPVLDQDFDFEFNFQQAPSQPAPKEKPKKEKKVEEVKKPVEQPLPATPIQQPPVQQPMYQPMPQMVPCYYFVPCHHPCHHPFHHPCHPPIPHSGMMPEMQMPAPPAKYAESDCGCGGSNSQAMPTQMGHYPMQDYNQQMFDPNQFMQGQMFPAQFPGADTSNFNYPEPPTYPNFPGMQQQRNKEEEEDKE
ncbi:SafA/ExsA family spore coat assembly protein [Oceanobacillus halophilus]|uniref:LysM peptidoglycan-binding domain-containing protein n=1 Tax=Oceanobacillus halophilus TaxID=930130 RepID=A0A495ADG0_9BACI|nr:SafA/ExsA family spore coat assembly protein [Oceanobacillus halophilus]RKQ37902.1 LysM peptidoglycan-binding domain-containing protein [Oceanobacillus halophilus]